MCLERMGLFVGVDYIHINVITTLVIIKVQTMNSESINKHDRELFMSQIFGYNIEIYVLHVL